MKSSIDRGFTVDGDTIAWWFEQGDEARKAVITKTAPIGKVLADFSKFVACKDDTLWAHKDFDLSILKEAYVRMNMPFPAHYRNMCDLRTLDKIAKMVKIKSDQKREGTYHTGGADSLYQAKVATDILMGLIRMSAVRIPV